MNEVTFAMLLIGGMYAAFLTADYARLRSELQKLREALDMEKTKVRVLKRHLSPQTDKLVADVMEADHVR